MIYPKFLQKFDTIAVSAPSDGKTDKLDLIRLDNAYSKLENIGFKIKEDSNVRVSINARSASALVRAKNILNNFKDKDTKAIISASGGEFLMEILPYIDANVIRNNPTWFCGYSDNTALSFFITTALDIATIYSDNISCFGMDNWHDSVYNFLEVLEGNIIIQNSFSLYQSNYLEYKTGLEGYNLDTKVNWCNLNRQKIRMSGRIVGGCLDVLLNLVGTRYDKVSEFTTRYKDDGIIWFLESCDLTNEQIIRGLWQLKEAGWFSSTKGFIFGRSVFTKTYTNTSYEDAIKTSLEELDVPIIIGADFGHTAPRMTLINGSYAKIKSIDGKGSIEMLLK